MIKRNLIIVISFLGIASCGENNNNKANAHIQKKSVKYEIRADTISPYSYIHDVRQKTKQLKLGSIESGSDSLEIRVWFNYSLALVKHLIIIEFKNEKWRGKLYEMYTDYVDTLTFDLIKDHDVRNIVPKSGWQNLMESLNHLKYRDLVYTGKPGADGNTYCVEIASPETYIYYDFWEPEFIKDTSWQANNMVKIIKLLEREFNFKSPI